MLSTRAYFNLLCKVAYKLEVRVKGKNTLVDKYFIDAYKTSEKAKNIRRNARKKLLKIVGSYIEKRYKKDKKTGNFLKDLAGCNDEVLLFDYMLSLGFSEEEVRQRADYG